MPPKIIPTRSKAKTITKTTSEVMFNSSGRFSSVSKKYLAIKPPTNGVVKTSPQRIKLIVYKPA